MITFRNIATSQFATCELLTFTRMRSSGCVSAGGDPTDVFPHPAQASAPSLLPANVLLKGTLDLPHDKG